MLVPMDPAVWDKTADNINLMLQLLKENPEYKLLESQDFGEDLPEDAIQQNTPTGEEEESANPVRANLLGFLERLDDELTKSYQMLDPQTADYTNRLQVSYPLNSRRDNDGPIMTCKTLTHRI